MSVNIRRRSVRARVLVGAAVVAALNCISNPTAHAADLFWDVNGATAGGSGTTTAAGTWGVDNFWSTSANGDIGTGAWVADSLAAFSAGTGVTGTYNVTVSGTQSASGIRFEEGAVTLTGGTINLSGATPTITAGTGTTNIVANIASAMTATGEVAFTKNSTGLGTYNLTSANNLAAVRLGAGVRMNANAAGSLGSGTITVDGTNAAITHTVNSSSVTFTNNIVVNPLNTAGFQFGLNAAGNSSTSATFSGNVSGSTDLLITPTPLSAGSTNGNGITFLSGNNSYTGKTYVLNATSGAFRLGSATALPTGTSLIFGRAGLAVNQNVGGADLNGQNISVAALASETSNTVQGLTNTNAGAGGGITITGGTNASFTGVIGNATISSLSTQGFTPTTNLSLTLAASHTGSLTLTRNNTYVGATTINGGTLVLANTSGTQTTIVSPATITSGGTLATLAGTQATVARAGGLITLNNGGVISPGGAAGGIGTLGANGGLTVNGGANFDFDLNGLTNSDLITVGGSGLTLDSGSHTVDVFSAAAPAAGTYTLMSYGTLTSDNVNLFTLGSTPGGAFSYSLNTSATALTLTVTPQVASLVWDLDANGAPIVEGAGTWQDGTNTFTDISTNSGSTFSSAGTADVTFGNDAAGSGGSVSLAGDVRTGGQLIFGPINDAVAPYSIDGTSTLTTVGGVTANVNATLNTPVVLETSQSWLVGPNKTLTANGNISDGAGGAKTLTKTGNGTLVLRGNNSFSGGLAINVGTVDAGSDASMGTGDVTIDAASTFRFGESFATDNNFVINAGGGRININSSTINGTISGVISGAGVMTKNGSGKLTITGVNPVASILVDAVTLAFSDYTNLGLFSMTIDGANIQPLGDWTSNKPIVLSGSALNNHIVVNGTSTVTLNGLMSGASDLYKDGSGTLKVTANNTGRSGLNVVPEFAADGSFQADGGIIETSAVRALGTGNLQVLAPVTINALSDLSIGAVRAGQPLTKNGPGRFTVTGSTTAGNVDGSIIVNAGTVQMDSREALGGTTLTPMAITLNAGTELRGNWGATSGRRSTNITLNDAWLRRIPSSPGETVYTAYDGDTYYNSTFTVTGSSRISNEQISNGSGINNLAIDMPVVLAAGATLTMQNDNNTGNYDTHNTSLRGTNNILHSGYDLLTMNDGSSIVMTGPGEKRIGGITTGKPIVVNGNASLKLDSRSFMSDLDGSGTGNEFTKVTINGGGLRIEAPMNASYTTPIDPEPTFQPAEGFTGFFGVNTTSTAEAGTPPTGYSVIGNAYTVYSPKRAAGLAGSTGTFTLAATDAAGATGRIAYGPSAPAANLRLAVDNTAASAGGALVYEIDALANGGTFGNFAGLDVKRSNAGSGSVRAKLVNSAARLGSVSVSDGASIDINDQKLILDNMPVGTGAANGGNYTAGSVSRLVQTASNGGAWDGPGITTSQPDATAGLTSIGVAAASDVRDFGLGTTLLFAGQTITPTSTLAMYTYAGDANLDGQITGDDYSGIDFTILDPNNTGGWFAGDFNYDGFVSGDDYSAIDFNILAQGAPFPTGAPAASLSGVTAVPEPATLSVLALGGAALLGRRRRRA
jgi:autotransporter-associated beta strand protein